MKNNKSLKNNTIANFVGVGYTSLIALIILPLYLQYLGAEAFGLVGFFTVLQAWMQILDMGMSPLLSRQVARARGQNSGFLKLKKLLRSLEIVVLFMALIVILSIGLGSEWIANQWLNINTLIPSEVAVCVFLMGATIGLRLFSSFYRSGIQGLENQVQLSIANIVIVTLRFVGALILLKFISQDIVDFFVYQIVIGVVELFTLLIMFYRLMPPTDKIGIRFYWGELKPVLPFSAGIAYAAVIWIVISQLDKILLSKILPLSEFGYFSLVVIVVTAINQTSAPISQAILPRLTYLLTQGKELEMLALYRKSTQFMSVIMFPLVGMIALFSTELIFMWTGDKNAAEWAAPVLFWYALGNGILAISAFQYCLQFAHGKLKMYVIYNTVSACIQVPLITYAAFEWGVYGVALVWFLIRLILFLIWTPIVHYKYATGLHWPWLLKDILPFFVTTTLLLAIISSFELRLYMLDRFELFLALSTIGLFVVIANVLVSNESRNIINKVIKSKLDTLRH